jgi:hypothetical protein
VRVEYCRVVPVGRGRLYTRHLTFDDKIVYGVQCILSIRL